jgi:hypothetical protein
MEYLLLQNAGNPFATSNPMPEEFMLPTQTFFKPTKSAFKLAVVKDLVQKSRINAFSIA